MKLLAVYHEGKLSLTKEINSRLPEGASLVFVKRYHEAGEFVALYFENKLKIVSELELMQLTGAENFDRALCILRSINAKFTTIKV